MTWVLIWMILGTSGPSASASSVEFSSKAACEGAKQALKKISEPGYDILAGCFAKGGK